MDERQRGRLRICLEPGRLPGRTDPEQSTLTTAVALRTAPGREPLLGNQEQELRLLETLLALDLELPHMVEAIVGRQALRLLRTERLLQHLEQAATIHGAIHLALLVHPTPMMPPRPVVLFWEHLLPVQ